MHIITALGAFAGGVVLRAAFDARPTEGSRRATAWLVRRLSLVIAMVGTIAFFDGAVQLANALATVEVSQWHLAAALGATLVPIPLVWSLMVGAFLLLGDAVVAMLRSRTIAAT